MAVMIINAFRLAKMALLKYLQSFRSSGPNIGGAPHITTLTEDKLNEVLKHIRDQITSIKMIVDADLRVNKPRDDTEERLAHFQDSVFSLSTSLMEILDNYITMIDEAAQGKRSASDVLKALQWMCKPIADLNTYALSPSIESALDKAVINIVRTAERTSH